MKFYFCETCGKRITDVDVEAGQARNKKLKGVYCSECAVGVMTVETLPVSEGEARKILGKAPATPSDTTPTSAGISVKPKRESARVQVAAARKASESQALARQRPSSVLPAAAKTNSVLVGVTAGLLVALLLGAILLTGGGKPKVETGGKVPAPTGGKVANAPLPTPPTSEKTIVLPSVASKSVPSSEKTVLPFVTSAVETTVAKTIEEPRAPTEAVPDAHEPIPVAKQDEPAKEIKVAKVDDNRAQMQFAEVLEQLSPLLRRNQFTEAEKLLDEKLRDPALAEIAGRLKKERTDLAEIRALRKRAIDALRAKNGSTIELTLRGAKVTGAVKAAPNSAELALVLRNGPEFVIKPEQLDVQDVDAFAPMETGAAKADDRRWRGMLFMAAGDAAKAEAYFSQARDAGLGDAVAPYLERIAALKQGEKETRALEALKKAEGLFVNKSWQAAKQAYEAFQRDHADSAALAKNAEMIKKRMDAIDEAVGMPKEVSLDLGGGVKLELMLIPKGEFEMGSNDGEKHETPVHKVIIPRLFYMGKYHVTQPQYEKVMGINPSGFKGENLPVEMVNYLEAAEFCTKASKLTGKQIKLPTEAEWEYACRAGTKTKFNTGDDEAALQQAGWFKGNGEGKTHPIGQKKPNAWGLYDMHGNVWQWCEDWYGEDYYSKSEAENPRGPAQGESRVLRGGSWCYDPMVCRSATRFICMPAFRFNSFGLRVVLVPAPKAP